MKNMFSGKESVKSIENIFNQQTSYSYPKFVIVHNISLSSSNTSLVQNPLVTVRPYIE